ncbi:MAG: 2-C-methyl-D-erythritol 4-phosphate cytidylyltransferase [Phycisphaerales bacterium]
MKLAVIIPAAGLSKRYAEGLEFPRSKLDEDLGGRPVLQRTVEMFGNHDLVTLVVVAGPAENAANAEFRQRYSDKLGLLGVKLVTGGEQRWQTVKNALDAVPAEFTHIAVHDAARPCTPPELLDRLFEAAGRYPAVIPALDVPDTLKRVAEREADDREIDPLDAILGGADRKTTRIRQVESTQDRERLVSVQTPQVFEAGLLRRAYAQPDLTSTDDAQLVERLGETVTVVEGDPRNIKITRPIDLLVARAVLGVKGPDGRPVHKRF